MIISCLLVAGSLTTSAAFQDANRELLINKTLTGWEHYSAEKIPLGDAWTVKKGSNGKGLVLVCSGKPNCYLRTTDNRFEWMYPDDENGSSGILIHTARKERIWPDSIQIQLHRAKAGSVFPSGNAKTENVLPPPPKILSRGLNVWNSCTLKSINGAISVTINDVKIGQVTGCMPNIGSIALQSEGSKIHFRKMSVTRITPGSHTEKTE